MGSREPFSIGEWYHCYNRGIDKRIIFEAPADYARFLEILHLANSTEPFHRALLKSTSLSETLLIRKRERIVSIGSFCLMPNHFHLLLKETRDGGITAFMRKVGTAYAMYFNTKHERIGNLLTKPFRSRHVGDDRYFQRCVRYIHCNPAELYEPTWKTGAVKNVEDLIIKLERYPYSSFGSYQDDNNILETILDEAVFDIVEKADPHTIVTEAAEYYASMST